MESLTYYIISHILVGIVSTILGVFVFLKDRKKNINRTFCFFSISVAIWAFSYGIWLLQDSPRQALFWARTLNFGATLIPVFFFHWLLNLLNLKRRVVLYYLYSITVFFALFSYSDYYIYETKEILQFVYFPQANWMYILFLLLSWCVSITYGLYLLIKELKGSIGYRKEQIKYVLLGLFIGFIGGSTNYILMLGFDFISPFGSPLVVFFPVLFGYAMVKHRLMDIKMVLRSSSVYLFSLITLLALTVSVKAFLDYYFPEIVDWTDFAILILAISVFPSIRNKYFRWANLYFFSSLYDPQKLIADLSDRLRTTLNIDRIYNFLYRSLDDAFHFKGFAILSYDDNKKNYYLEFNKGFSVGRKKKFEGSFALHNKLIGHNKTIITEEIKKDFYNNSTKDVIDLLVALHISVLIPLNIKDRIVGLIALGEKESGDAYTESDFGLFEIVGAQAATAVENAFLYEKTLNFNIKLKEEVQKAIRELVKANNKLKKLDEAKSEFISIASHQLRTPLTIIKGYISMILEGNFGELTKGEKESLEKVYLSNERLIGLVENLLNISRIESGRLQFDYKKMQLGDIITSVFEELKPKAKEKKLRFTYRKTKKKLPALKIDEEKIRQVVMNMADNAIKYTKKGSVTISLKEVTASDAKMGECLEFKVSDSGMGILADDLPNLFKKFSRGTGTSLIHTEGTGLGLYVAKQMIEAHGGKVWAESKGEGKGSKFCFRIPVDDSARKTET